MGRSIISTSVDVTNAYRAMPSQTAWPHNLMVHAPE